MTTPSGQRLLDRFRAGPYSDMAAIVEQIEKEARIVPRIADGSEPCPGHKRACGVLTPRRLCYFCQRTKERERK